MLFSTVDDLAIQTGQWPSLLVTSISLGTEFEWFLVPSNKYMCVPTNPGPMAAFSSFYDNFILIKLLI